MPDLPVHPAIVHIPLGLALAMPFVAIALAVAVWKGMLPRRTLAVVVGLQLLLAAAAVAAGQTGDADEDAAERVAPRDAVHDHEEAGERVIWSSVVVLALSAAAAFVPTRRVGLLAALTAAGTVAVAAFAVDAGRKGGDLVFRYGAGMVGAGPQAAPGGAAPPAAHHGDDDH
ncbi:MAG TPA: hypothetical protein VEB43_10945 [Anaeromyxobacter sp.]|nr:hypothetical protein [Anaeromyxobacter sp.]